MAEQLTHIWVGIDAGKAHHWVAAVDETGATIWSKKIPNDESAILIALGEILPLADKVQRRPVEPLDSAIKTPPTA